MFEINVEIFRNVNYYCNYKIKKLIIFFMINIFNIKVFNLKYPTYT